MSRKTKKSYSKLPDDTITISQKQAKDVLVDHRLDRPDNSAVIHQYVIQLLAKHGIQAAIGSISKDGIKLGSSRPMIPFAPAEEQQDSASLRLKTLNFFNMGSRTLTYPDNTRKLTTYKNDYQFTSPKEFQDGIPLFGKFHDEVYKKHPKPIVLYHSREKKFPSGKVKPYFHYNWYSNIPYWPTYGALYQYQIKEPIEEVLVIVNVPRADDNPESPQLFNAFGEIITELNNLLPQGKRRELEEARSPAHGGNFSDYAIAAFLMQVLQLNGFVHTINFVVLSKDAGDRYLECKDSDCVDERDGVEEEEEYGADQLSQLAMGAGGSNQLYTEELAQELRDAILKKAIPTTIVNRNWMRRGGKKRKTRKVKKSRKNRKSRKRKNKKRKKSRKRKTAK